ncbi:hypothetical protein FCL40_06865 [Ferrimonas sediminicola]|uniref:WD40-like Beta Propeller Repeat n=1 Tax=Ferrimonas sediminicola TaxID=2569538 RepID=A0A4V5NVB3_9GAMM|nr:hypothetical protein [Ferrimonas sediminicola]TKB49869.1 hypothetical protein FCL40_06865 [Ferrimonas sediminicola]
MRSALFAALLVALMTRLAWATPDRHWQTLETEHYRIHFTPEHETWARRLALDADRLQRAVGEAVGHQLPAKVDLVVRDPLNLANGFALPLIGRSRTVFYTTPPLSDSLLSHMPDWPTLLLVHEQAHLNHLARESRAPLTQLWQSLYVGLLEVPRWVSEGYATVIEHRHDGKGRPANALAQGVLMQWAREGYLPNYAQLSADEDAYLGMSMAYLVGASYLLWLQQEYGEPSLKQLWTRMAAREPRSFEQAFEGVFGQGPERLYRRFVAETTYQAMSQEAQAQPETGGQWLEHHWQLSPPTISPSGEQLAVIQGDQKGYNQSLVVVSTAGNEPARQAWLEKRQARQQADPLDVPDIEPAMFNPQVLHTLNRRSGPMVDPVWLDEDRILFSQLLRDERGAWHFDLHLWQLSSHRVTRLTHEQNLVRPAPHPDGRRVLALQRKGGHSTLMELDLTSGTLTERVSAGTDEILDFPGYRPGEDRLSYLKHRRGEWDLYLSDGQSEIALGLPRINDGNFVSYPSWQSPDALLITLGTPQGVANYRLRLSDRSLSRLTSYRQLATAPRSDGDVLYFLATTSQGQSLYRQPLTHPPLARHSLAPTLATSPAGTPEQDPRPATVYGVGPQYAALAIGANLTPWQQALELGVKGGDPVNRLRWQLLGQGDTAGTQQGAIASLRWQGWPVVVNGDLLALEQEFSALKASQTPWLSERRLAAHLGLDWQRRLTDALQLGLEAGTTLGEVTERHSGRDSDWRSSYLGMGLAGAWRRGPWSLGGRVGGRQTWGDSLDGWQRSEGALALSLGWQDWTLVGNAALWELGGSPSRLDLLRLGGAPSSLTPDWLPWGQLTDAALPHSALVGERLDRLGLSLGQAPLQLFYRSYQMDRGNRLPVAGVNLELEGIAPYIFDALPEFDGMQVRMGVGWAGDNGIEAPIGWSGWLSLYYRL